MSWLLVLLIRSEMGYRNIFLVLSQWDLSKKKIHVVNLSGTACEEIAHRCNVNTVEEVHEILPFSRGSDNSDWILQWWSMGKHIFKHE